MALHPAGLTRAALAVLLAVPAGLPQQPQKEELPPTIKVEVNVVNILASVRDKRGGLIANLSRDDFTLSEDGKPQEIKYFEKETNLPLTIGLLVDVSGSQKNLIETERQAAYQFFSQVLRKKDMAFLISFGEECELLQDYTGSARLLENGLNQLHLSVPVGGLHPGPVPTVYNPRGTVLFDAVYLASNEKLSGEVGRKVLVLITDGVDQGSRISRDKSIEAAQRADAVIYSIYYVDPSAYGFGFGHPSDGDLRRMSDQTGGREFRVDRKHTLADVFKELQDEMRSQYAIGYTPTNATQDDTFRKIDLRTKDKNYKVQARAGYYASKSEAKPGPR